MHFSRPSNNSKLIEIQTELGLTKGNVIRVCDTRWVCRYRNCNSIINNYSAIIKFLKNEIEEADKDVVEAIGNIIKYEILPITQKCCILF